MMHFRLCYRSVVIYFLALTTLICNDLEQYSDEIRTWKTVYEYLSTFTGTIELRGERGCLREVIGKGGTIYLVWLAKSDLYNLHVHIYF